MDQTKTQSKLDVALKAGIGVLLAALAFVIVNSLRERITDVGDTAPSFSIVTDQGRRITPTSFGGRLLVLNFWATWCAPCVEEVPSLSAGLAQTCEAENSTRRVISMAFGWMRSPARGIQADGILQSL